MNKADRELFEEQRALSQNIREKVLLMESHLDSEFSRPNGTYHRAITSALDSIDSMKEEIREMKGEFKYLQDELNPIKKFIKNLTDTLMWFLRIAGAAIVLYFVHQAIERYDIGADNINNNKHNNTYKEVVD